MSASSVWISWALRKSSKVSIAAEIARRCRVGRSAPSPLALGSVLVIVPSVYGVPVSVVQVVDMVAVLDRGVPATGAVQVPVRLVDGVVRAALHGDREGDLGPATALDDQPHREGQ